MDRYFKSLILDIGMYEDELEWKNIQRAEVEFLIYLLFMKNAIRNILNCKVHIIANTDEEAY